MRYIFTCVIVWLFCCCSSAMAQVAIPAALQPWSDWVSYKHDNLKCPRLLSGELADFCAWPGLLKLQLDPLGAQFSQSWQAYANTWLQLPGGTEFMPQNVTVDGVAAAVTLHADQPAIYVGAGTHQIAGELIWAKMPQRLQVPQINAALSVKLADGLWHPQAVDADGVYWINSAAALTPKPTTENSLEVRVMRKFNDEVPQTLETQLDLDVSGQDREISLGQVLLAGQIPTGLQAAIPAVLDSSGQLKIKVRPGTWRIYINSRFNNEQHLLQAPAAHTFWPKYELWVLATNPRLRSAYFEGGNTVDPSQTYLPHDWWQYPAWRLANGQSLKLVAAPRTTSAAAQSDLNLQRNMWLNFSGAAWTLQDNLQGVLRSEWRLDLPKPFALGQAQLNGQPQLITAGADQNGGLEIRTADINLQAVSTMPGSIAKLPVSGWNVPVKSVNTTVYLPPGWQLLHASGVGEVSGTWVQSWSLLNIFLGLLLVIVTLQLFGTRWAVVAAITMLISLQEQNGLIYLWLNALAIAALLRLLPKNRLQTVAQYYQLISIVVLALALIPFAAQQLRLAFYPQLAAVLQGPQPLGTAMNKLLQHTPRIMAPALMRATAALPAAITASAAPVVNLEVVNPGSKIQTGPAIPQWQWQPVYLNWGPVEPQQTMRLWLLSPSISRCLNILRVLGVAALLLMLARVYMRPLLPKTLQSMFGLVLLLFTSSALMGYAPHSYADGYPPGFLLKELQQRILAPATCAPQCAAIEMAKVIAKDNTIKINLVVNSLDNIAVPLPYGPHWLLQSVSVDGKQADWFVYKQDQTLSLALPAGHHSVELQGSVEANTNEVKLQFPLLPGFVNVDATGVAVQGLREGKLIADSLTLSFAHVAAPAVNPANAANAQTVAETYIPPFVEVTRELQLDQEWQVTTTVVRRAPTQGAIAIAVPLLPGEKITQDVPVNADQVQVSLAAGQQSFSWQSKLPQLSRLTFTAAQNPQIASHWRLYIASKWGLAFNGVLPLLRQQDFGPVWFEWQLWPGQQVNIFVQQLEALQGATATIDSVRMLDNVGKDLRDTELYFNWRSSLGGQYDLKLPADHRVTHLQTDGVDQPIRQEGQHVLMLLTPGQHTTQINLQSHNAVGLLNRTTQVDFAQPLANIELIFKLEAERWIVALGGPNIGPGVLFWGVLVLLVVISFALSKIPLTPLGFTQWLLLGIGFGLSASWLAALLLAALLFMLGKRAQLQPAKSAFYFNSLQVLIVLFAAITAVVLFKGIAQGLLGQPNMQIVQPLTGDLLHWYKDFTPLTMPHAWVLTLPMWCYRVIMLAWALWFVFALLRWLSWMWQCFTVGGMWVKLKSPF